MSPLLGLVLAGGRSARMGRDKGALVYPARSPRPIARHLAGLLHGFCAEVFVSLRPDQPGWEGIPRLNDTLAGAGPAAGLLAAHARAPEAAWLAVACDYPFVGDATLRQLAGARSPDAQAVCFRQSDGRPEPLLAVWEPAALAALAAAHARGNSSPRATLERIRCRLLAPLQPEALANVNSPAEAQAFGLAARPAEA